MTARARLPLAFAAATGLLAAMLGQPLSLKAAGSIGPYYGARVVCDSYLDRVTVNARAGAAPEFNSQTIYYRIYLYQEGVGWRAVNPSPSGSFVHTRGVTYRDPYSGYITTRIEQDAAGTAWTISPGVGRYAFYTEYWWWDNTAWVGPVGAWSTWVEYPPLVPFASYWCDLGI